MKIGLNKFKIIKLYKQGLTLKQIAYRLGCSMQNVHQIIKRYKPDMMREPHRRY